MTRFLTSGGRTAEPLEPGEGVGARGSQAAHNLPPAATHFQPARKESGEGWGGGREAGLADHGACRGLKSSGPEGGASLGSGRG